MSNQIKSLPVPDGFFPQHPNFRLLADRGRGMGIFVLATRGTGKTRLLGRVIAWQDFIREVPLVIIDPVGALVDTLFDKITRLPKDEQEQLWSRIRYVNMNGGEERVTPWPIYYRARPDEPLEAIATRYVDHIKRSDMALTTASIQGFNRLKPLATATGMILAALDLGITHADHLVSDPASWQDRVLQAVERNPQARPAAEYFRDLISLQQSNVREFELRVEVLRNKLSLFRFNQTLRAMYGAITPGIDWQEVIDKRLAMLIDYRDVRGAEAKQFGLLWVYGSLLQFIKDRGPGRHIPLSVLIDEVSYLVGSAGVNTDVLADDLDELINRIARNHGIWVTIATQELFQLPTDQIRKTLLSMGNCIFGRTSDQAAAELLSAKYFQYDPFKVKRERIVWGSFQGEHYEIDREPVEYSMAEQVYLNAKAFLELPTFHFLVGGSLREGMLPTQLRPITIERIDQGLYTDEPIAKEVRRLLQLRDGKPVLELLQQINGESHGAEQSAEDAGAQQQSPPRTIIGRGKRR